MSLFQMIESQEKKLRMCVNIIFKIKIEMCTSSNKIMEWNNQIINGKLYSRRHCRRS